MIWEALTLQAGYNSALVAVGAALLGLAAGGAGAFVFLRKRALVSDAVSHATLPGVGLAFLAMAALGGDGRWLPGLLLGAAGSAALGLLGVDWLTRATRLTEDAAIGAVLSAFFGLGIVLLTVIQGAGLGRPAGLDTMLLGATAGMLASEAWTLAAAGALAAAVVALLRRPMTLVAFDPDFARTRGVPVAAVDLATMGLALAVTVIGLKIVGLVLILALLIIPPVTARFWTDRVEVLVPLAAGLGGAAAYLGAALSASAAGLPTGPIIVLVAFGLFALSLVLSPRRGLLAQALRHRAEQARVHRRQGLLALARSEPIYDRLTLRLLRREGLIRPDGVATGDGRAAAAKAALDEARWVALRRRSADDPLLAQDGLTPLETLLTADQLADLDRSLPLGAAP